MEKFGIFELLDALSAITAGEKTDAPPPDPAPKTDDAAAEKQPKRPDAAFSPPSYGMENAAAPTAERTAYDGFLARHESMKNKVKK